MERENKGSKAADRVRRKVRETVERYGLLERGDHVVIGLSGGPDSVCLFFLLLELAEEYSLSLHPVHVNHQLRGEAADEDQRYVQDLCRSRQLSCRVVSRNVKEMAAELGMGTEEAGRLVRYQAFLQEGRRVCPGGGAKTAVAQNRLDQAETVLMRLLRGSGTQGLAGMEPLSKEGIIRPLLFTDRQDIEAFCREEGLSPRIDQTNLEPLYQRNRIRLELLPYLKEQYNQNIVGALTRLASIAAEDRDYFQRQAEEWIRLHAIFQPESGKPEGMRSESGKSEDIRAERARNGETQSESAQISVKELTDLHPALRKRVILALLGRLGLDQDVSAVHLDQAERLLKEGRTSSQTYFPEGYRMKIRYEQAVFFREDSRRAEEEREKEPSCQEEDSVLFLSGSCPTGKKILAIHCEGVLSGRFSGKMMEEESFDADGWETGKPGRTSSLVGLFDAEALIALADQQGLWLRTRRPGDRIRLSGAKGSKKLQDFFVDEKVPREERDGTPLLCAGQNVLWIPGLWAGRDCRINEGTQMILLLEYYK